MTDFSTGHFGQAWWGNFELVEHELKAWVLHNRFIAIQKLQDSFRVLDGSKDLRNNIDRDALEIRSDLNDEDLAGANEQRLLVGNSSNTLLVKPLLADRSVVVKPSNPLSVLAKESVSLFISSPLWLSFVCEQDFKSTRSHGKTSFEKQLLELPLQRPTDSWFGTSSMQGELCYAIYSDAFSQLSQITHRASHAVTQINIDNQSDSPLLIRRLKVPMSFLNLYQDANGHLFTDTLSVFNEDEKSKPKFKIEKRNSMGEHRADSKIADARKEPDSNVFFASIKGLIE